MNAVTVEMLARILACHAEMHAMVAANQQRLMNNQAIAYDELAFDKVAQNLRAHADQMNLWRKDGFAQ
jgi:hypothetical protein